MTGSNHAPALRGAMTALVTPFRNGKIDWTAFDQLVERQINGGTDWLVPLGTTGESPTLSVDERDRLLERVVARTAGRRPIMAGTGTNSTAETVERTKKAAAAGAAAALVVVPYYNRPTQEGLFHHFAAVADAATIPIVLYNVPARTGVSLQTDTIVRLHEKCPNIVALKDAAGSPDLLSDLLRRSDLVVLCGDDTLTFPWILLGAKGVISVLSNLSPQLMKSLVVESLAANLVAARPLHQRVFDLSTALGRHGPNPVPIKTAMALVGLIAEEFRLPLCPLDEASRTQIGELLRRHEIVRKNIG